MGILAKIDIPKSLINVHTSKQLVALDSKSLAENRTLLLSVNPIRICYYQLSINRVSTLNTFQK